MKLVVALSLLAVAAVGCGPVPSWHGIIKVAVVAPYSGPATAAGASLLAGARLAEHTIDATGGIGGYRIEVVAADEMSASTPSDVSLDPEVVAVIGHVLPDGARAADVYQSAGIPWLSTEPVIRAPGRYPLVAEMGTIDGALSQYLARADGLSSSQIQRAVAECQKATSTPIDLPNGRLICSGNVTALEMALTDASSGERVVCVVGLCSAPEAIKWSHGARYIYISLFDPTKLNATKASQFKADLKGGAPDLGMAEVGFDAMQVVFNAIRRAERNGPPTRAAIELALAGTNQTGLLGSYGPEGRRNATVDVREASTAWPGKEILRVEASP